MKARHVVAASILALGAGLAGMWMTAPRPGIETYAVNGSGSGVFLARTDDRQPLGGGAVRVTFLGATTLLFDDGRTQFLIDGFLTRPGMWRSLRVRTQPAVVDAALEKAGVDPARFAAVFVSHTHFDHAMDVAYIVNKYPAAVLYGSSSAHQIGCGGGVPSARNQVIEAGREIVLGEFSVIALASMHSPDPDFPGDIRECLAQPAWNWQYREGGSFDFLVRHGEHTLLFKGGANVAAAPPAGGPVDVLFLSVGLVGKQDAQFERRYFDETVTRLRPRLVIPMHWDDFFAPLSSKLEFSMRMADDAPRAFDALLADIAGLDARPDAAHVEFRLLQGYESLVLFRPQPAPDR